MRKIFFIIFLLISIVGFSQNPPNYQYRVVYERLRGMMPDSAFHLPRYNGVPSGLRGGMSPMDGALAADTLNGHIYRYHNTTWGRLALYADIAAASQRFGVTGEDRIAAQERTFSGLNHTYSFRFDSLNTWDVARNGIQRMYVNSTATGLYTPNGLNGVQLFNDSIQIKQISGNYSIYNLPQRFDTSANKVLTWNASTLKLGWSSYFGGAGGGSGTVNTGAALKAAYYPSAAALVDDWVGVEFGNTNLNTKITAQATTEVPLEIKLAGSQTANALNLSSSAGTGDLANISAAGKITTVSDFVTTGGDLYIRSSTPAVYIGRDQQVNTYPGIWFGANAATPTTTNFSFLYSTPQTTINGPGLTGSILFEINNDFNNALLYASNKNLGVGFAYNGTPTGRVHIAAGTATANTAPLKLTTGTALTTPEDGAMEYHSSHLYFTIGSTRYQLDQQKPSLNKGVFIQAPTSADIVDVWQTPVAITVTSLKAILRGTTPSVTYNVRFGTDITSATTVFTSDITCTSVTTGCSNSSGFNDATIPAGSFIWVYTTAASGTINSISFTINYTED